MEIENVPCCVCWGCRPRRLCTQAWCSHRQHVLWPTHLSSDRSHALFRESRYEAPFQCLYSVPLYHYCIERFNGIPKHNTKLAVND